MIDFDIHGLFCQDLLALVDLIFLRLRCWILVEDISNGGLHSLSPLTKQLAVLQVLLLGGSGELFVLDFCNVTVIVLVPSCGLVFDLFLSNSLPKQIVELASHDSSMYWSYSGCLKSFLARFLHLCLNRPFPLFEYLLIWLLEMWHPGSIVFVHSSLVLIIHLTILPRLVSWRQECLCEPQNLL